MGEQTDQMNEQEQTGGRSWRAVAAWAGLVLHVGLGIFPYSATGLLAPYWAVGILAAWWALLLAAGWRWRTIHPARTAFLPLVTLGSWWLFLTFGDLVLGWTA